MRRVWYFATIQRLGNLPSSTPSPLVGEGWGEGVLAHYYCQLEVERLHMHKCPGYFNNYPLASTPSPHTRQAKHKKITTKQSPLPLRERVRERGCLPHEKIYSNSVFIN
jgi:hypothetical protein